MRRTSTGTVCLVWPVLLAGCVASVQPIHTDDDLIFDPALLGAWASEDSRAIYVVTEGEGRAYSVWGLEADRCAHGRFVMHLADVDGLRFLDIRLADPGSGSGMIALHSILLLDELTDSTMTARALDEEWLSDYLEETPDAIAYDEERSLLTASTVDLQRFYLEHIGTPGAFTEPDRWMRLDDEGAQRLVGRFVLSPQRGPPPPPPPPRTVGDDEAQAPRPPALSPCTIAESLDGR